MPCSARAPPIRSDYPSSFKTPMASTGREILGPQLDRKGATACLSPESTWGLRPLPNPSPIARQADPISTMPWIDSFDRKILSLSARLLRGRLGDAEPPIVNGSGCYQLVVRN